MAVLRLLTRDECGRASGQIGVAADDEERQDDGNGPGGQGGEERGLQEQLRGISHPDSMLRAIPHSKARSVPVSLRLGGFAG